MIGYKEFWRDMEKFRDEIFNNPYNYTDLMKEFEDK